MIALLAAITFASLAHADAEVDKALLEVQKDMATPNFGSRAEKMSPNAKKAVDQVRGLSGGDTQAEQDIYSLSSDIFGNMKGKSTEEIQALLTEAERNPAKFAESLTPAQKEKLHQLGQRLEKSRGSGKPH